MTKRQSNTSQRNSLARLGNVHTDLFFIFVDTLSGDQPFSWSSPYNCNAPDVTLARTQIHQTPASVTELKTCARLLCLCEKCWSLSILDEIRLISYLVWIALNFFFINFRLSRQNLTLTISYIREYLKSSSSSIESFSRISCRRKWIINMGIRKTENAIAFSLSLEYAT